MPRVRLARTESLFTVLEAGKGLLTAELVRRFPDQMAATILSKPHRCQQAMRQPFKPRPKCEPRPHRNS